MYGRLSACYSRSKEYSYRRAGTLGGILSPGVSSWGSLQLSLRSRRLLILPYLTHGIYLSLRMTAIHVSVYSPQWVKRIHKTKTKSRPKSFTGANFQSVSDAAAQQTRECPLRFCDPSCEDVRTNLSSPGTRGDLSYLHFHPVPETDCDVGHDLSHQLEPYTNPGS